MPDFRPVVVPHMDIATLFNVQPCSVLLSTSRWEFSVLPLRLPPPATGSPIQPGIFKGTYGAHGVELLLLSYDDNGSEAVVTKLTVSILPSYPMSGVMYM